MLGAGCALRENEKFYSLVMCTKGNAMINNKFQKIVSWVVILCSCVGIYVFVVQSMSQVQNNLNNNLTILALSIVGIIAGVLALKGNKIGMQLIIVFWGIQIVQIMSPSFMFAFHTGVTFYLHYTTANFIIALNIFALTMFFMSLHALNKNKKAIENE